jgi:uncharacterized protein YqjF (DUF2071 family)
VANKLEYIEKPPSFLRWHGIDAKPGPGILFFSLEEYAIISIQVVRERLATPLLERGWYL